MARKIISFSAELAMHVGFENAAFLQDIAYWCDYNKSSDVNFFDGRYWSFSTQNELCDRHPYWTKKQLRRIIKNCTDNGWLLTGGYSKNPYDRTIWYAVSDEIMLIINGQLDVPKWANGADQMGISTSAQTGTSYNINNIDNNTVEKSDKNNENEKNGEHSKAQESVIQESKKQSMPKYKPEWFERFWKAYPRRTSRAMAVKAWDNIRPDRELCDIMSEAIKKQISTEQWSDARYIPHPSTWLNQRRWEDEEVMSAEELRRKEREAKKKKMIKDNQERGTY